MKKKNKKKTLKATQSQKVSSTGPTPGERESAQQLVEHWKKNPKDLRQFQRALFGDAYYKWARDNIFMPSRYLEAATAVLARDEGECEYLFDTSREEMATELKEMASDPDNKENIYWLKTVEYALGIYL